MLLVCYYSGPNQGTSQVVSIDPGLREVNQRRELTKHVFDLVRTGVQWSVNLDHATGIELKTWTEIEDSLGVLDMSEEILGTFDDEEDSDDVVYEIFDDEP
ncbi:MAG: hypothetical protein ABIG32_01380 [Candidatus Uhrbacteria bacterium]|nr:hypothetical protein [Patescibacteria group bacterium]MBU1907159.1 hypothetical protein [Patescibacteria group bacterium]